jgi:hypothetical protein
MTLRQHTITFKAQVDADLFREWSEVADQDESVTVGRAMREFLSSRAVEQAGLAEESDHAALLDDDDGRVECAGCGERISPLASRLCLRYWFRARAVVLRLL